MRSNTQADVPRKGRDEQLEVHVWRVRQLIRLGLAWPAAEAVADQVDWHAVAELVRRGCPATLAVTIVS
jgi:hypothetical protein